MSNHIPFLGRFLTEPAFLLEGSATGLLQPMTAEPKWVAEFREQITDKPQLTADGVGILTIKGVLARDPSTFELYFEGLTDSATLLDQLEGLKLDPACKRVLLVIDSPGGFVTGVPELADAVKDLGKPCVAWTGGLCCSAAYWIGSQADNLVASRSAIVGSIGAYTAVVDATRFWENMGVEFDVIKNKEGKYKAAGLTRLQDVQREQLQASIQATFDQFKADILRSRPGVSADTMQGQTFSGEDARGRSLIDAVGSMSYAMALLRSMPDEEDDEDEQ